jgi:hypothetical protein
MFERKILSPSSMQKFERLGYWEKGNKKTDLSELGNGEKRESAWNKEK